MAKEAVWTLLQPVLRMVIGPVTAPLGTVAVICVSLLVKLAVTLLENLTPLTPVKFDPVMVTVLPIAPLVGLMLFTVGQVVPEPVETTARIIALTPAGDEVVAVGPW